MHLLPNVIRRPGVHPPAPAVGFPVWQTIELGMYKAAVGLVKAALDSGHLIVGSALDLMANPTFPLAHAAMEVDLVSVSVADLGFTTRTPLCWVYERARQLGLQLCPPEVGPQLLLQHRRGKIEETILLVGMNLVVGSRGRLGGFALIDGEHDNRWLIWHSIGPTSLCPPNLQFVFVLPRQHGTGDRALAVVRHFGRQ